MKPSVQAQQDIHIGQPKSASSSITSRPCAAMDTAKFAETVVLPTPPLPPVTAITLTGREELSSARAAARAGNSRLSRMSVSSAEVAYQVGLIACGGLPSLSLRAVRTSHTRR